jgi:hypothetical protein
LQDAGELDVHYTQAHESADGDFVFQRKGQVPHHSNREKCADDVGEDRYGCATLSVTSRTGVLQNHKHTCLEIDRVNPDIGIPALVMLAGPVRRDRIALSQQHNVG